MFAIHNPESALGNFLPAVQCSRTPGAAARELHGAQARFRRPRPQARSAPCRAPAIHGGGAMDIGRLLATHNTPRQLG